MNKRNTQHNKHLQQKLLTLRDTNRILCLDFACVLMKSLMGRTNARGLGLVVSPHVFWQGSVFTSNLIKHVSKTHEEGNSTWVGFRGAYSGLATKIFICMQKNQWHSLLTAQFFFMPQTTMLLHITELKWSFMLAARQCKRLACFPYEIGEWIALNSLENASYRLMFGG